MSVDSSVAALRRRRRSAAADYVRAGWGRVRDAALPVFIAAVAAGIAYMLSWKVLGQPLPFFAPAAAWISLGFERDRTVRKVAELAIGVSLGVALGEFLAYLLGVGPWQVGLALIVAALLARLLDRGPLMTAQAGLQAIIIVVLPASLGGGALGRWSDALVGGVVALCAAVLVPGRSWLRARALGESSLAEVAGTLSVLAVGMERGEARRAADSLTRARSAQPVLDAWRGAVAAAQEAARFSPFARRHRPEVVRLAVAQASTDHAMRNARVVTRRAITALDEIDALPHVAELVRAMAESAEAISAALGSGADPASVRPALRAVALELQPERFDDGWRVQSLVALSRSLLVDLLKITGMTHEEAKAALTA